MILFRFFYVTEPGQSDCDRFLAPFLVFSITGISHSMQGNRMDKAMAFLGRHSTYMWLTHTFWIYYYFQKVVLLPRLSILIFIWAVLIALGNAVLFDRVHRLIFRK